MFRKVAIALVAASMLAAPVMAQTPAATDTKPAATTTDKSAPSTSVKANKAKSNKHSRAMHNTRTASHKPVTMVKHARHFNAGKSHKVANAAKSHKVASVAKSHKVAHATKSHKVAGTVNKVVSAKSAARSSVN
jgi:hypothetical protein